MRIPRLAAGSCAALALLAMPAPVGPAAWASPSPQLAAGSAPAAPASLAAAPRTHAAGATGSGDRPSGASAPHAQGVAAASLTAAGRAVGSSTSPTARRARPTVARSQLPRASEVSAAFPKLAGGRRSLSRAEREDNAGNGSCFNWRTTLRAPTGRWASYIPADGSVPYVDGRDDPTVFTYRYRTAAQARQAMTRLSTWLRRCAGRHGDRDAIAWKVRKRTPRGVGSPAIGMSLRSVYPGRQGPLVHGETQVVTRSGRFVTFAVVQASGREPKLSKAVRLARISRAALR